MAINSICQFKIFLTGLEDLLENLLARSLHVFCWRNLTYWKQHLPQKCSAASKLLEAMPKVSAKCHAHTLSGLYRETIQTLLLSPCQLSLGKGSKMDITSK